MQTDLIKLKVRETASTGDPASLIESKFISACENLNASIFEPLIEEDQYFQSLDKYRFLQSLKDEFDRARERGTFVTTLVRGTCKGCHLGHQTYQFYGRKLIPEFSYIIHREDGRIEDIFICNMSSGAKVVDMRIMKDFEFWKGK